MSKKILSVFAIAFLTASPVLAGSITDNSTDWSGFYAGVQGGAWIHPTSHGTVVGQVGYLNDIGSIVIGAEAYYSYLVGPGMHRFGAEAIAGFDAGSVMPHVTVGGEFLKGSPVLGQSAGAGISFMMSDNVMLTGRYRFNYLPPAKVHEGIAAVSFKF